MIGLEKDGQQSEQSLCILTTISPLSNYVISMQGTPRPVMLKICAGIVRHSFVREWNAATFARSCFLRANCWHRNQ